MPQANTTEDQTPGSWVDRKRHAEERSQTLADMQKLLKDAEADKGRDLTVEENARFDELNTRAEQLAAKIEKYDQLIEARGRIGDTKGPESRSHRPGQHDIVPGQVEGRDEQTELEQRAFSAYLRTGQVDPEVRSLTVSAQGVVGVRPFSSALFDKLNAYAGVREAGAEIMTTSHGNPMTIPTGDDTANTGRLVGEAATNANVTEPTMGNLTLGAYKFSSDWIKVSLELLQDADYDVEAYIMRKAAERIGRAFNAYSTTGTGSGQPQGVVTASTAGKVAASTSAVVYDELLDLIHAVDAAYRNLPSFSLMLHDTTLAALRKLKDSAGAYIWSAGAAGAPNQILGYRYTVNNAMPQLSDGASSKVLLAGDFGRYMVRDVTGPFITRAVEKFSDDGLIGFKVDSRHDGKLADSSAIKHLSLAAA